MSYEKFKNWLHTSKYKQVIRTNANQDQMMLDAWNACLEMQSQAQQEPAKTKHHPICDRRYPSLCDACNAEAKEESQAQPAELSPEFYAEYEYKYPDWDVVVSVYQRRNDNEPLLIHQELLKAQLQSQEQQESKPVIAYEVRAYGRMQKIIVRDDVAEEYADKLKADGCENVEVRDLVYALPPAPEGDKT